MQKITRIAAVVTAAFSLTACLEVDDNGQDDQIVLELQQHNELLLKQSELAKTPITLYGTVIDLGTNEPVTGAKVKLKLGHEWRDAVDVENGEFSIEALPSSTDYEILVESPEGSFLDKTYTGVTRVSIDGQAILQNLGELVVSESIVKSFSVLDADSSEPITGLEFKTIINTSFNNSGVKQQTYVSTFNSDTNQYSITLPKYEELDITASMDIDNDGILDYTPDLSGLSASSFYSESDLRIDNKEFLNVENLYLVAAPELRELEIRVSVIDEAGEAIQGLDLFIPDPNKGRVLPLFDNETGQYILNVKFSTELNINIPAFSDESESYSSSAIRINAGVDSIYRVYLLGSSSYTSSFNVKAIENGLDLVIQPQLTAATDSPKVIAKALSNETLNPEFKIFYSSPISINEASYRLEQLNVLDVIEGNASDTDDVLEGSAYFSVENKKIEVTAELAHKGTFLTLTPTEVLSFDYDYRFSVDTVLDVVKDEDVNINSDEVVVYTADKSVFDISQVKYDNNNYTTGGEVIKRTNTAGESNAYYNLRGTAYLYFPRSIMSLDNFELKFKSQDLNFGGFSPGYSYTVVENGQFNYSNNITTTYSVAQNENELGAYYSVEKGAAVPNGSWYSHSTNEYLYDNTDINTNTVTFDYSFETKEGVKETGEITLPVL